LGGYWEVFASFDFRGKHDMLGTVRGEKKTGRVSVQEKKGETMGHASITRKFRVAKDIHNPCWTGGKTTKPLQGQVIKAGTELQLVETEMEVDGGLIGEGRPDYLQKKVRIISSKRGDEIDVLCCRMEPIGGGEPYIFVPKDPKDPMINENLLLKLILENGEEILPKDTLEWISQNHFREFELIIATLIDTGKITKEEVLAAHRSLATH